MSKGFASSYRIGLLATGLFVCLAAVSARLVWLHVIDRDDLLRSLAKARGQNNPIAESARRGDILDQRGTVLATSRSLILAKVTPGSLRDKDRQKWPQLAALLGMPLPALEKILTTKFRSPTPVKSASSSSPKAGLVFNLNLPPTAGGNTAATTDAGTLTFPAPVQSPAADASEDEGLDPTPDRNGLKVVKWAYLTENPAKPQPIPESTYREIEKLNINGIGGDRVYQRIYPHNELAAHVVGYVDRSKDQNPATGIERYADFYLRGHDGWREGERDGRNHELAQFRTREVPQADGYGVTLSIDANVQDIVEQELAFIAQKYEPLKATIIVSDPRTGFILGLGNYPTFNPNEYNKVPEAEQARMKNIALTDVYEPGSVFKIVAASGALEEGLVTPASTFDCQLTSVEYQGSRDRFPTVRRLPAEDKSDHFDHPLTVAEIIAHSSNKGAAQLAMKLGDERFYGYVRAFGFGQRTNLPGGHEEPGLVYPPRLWDTYTITRMPMGQNIGVTVMQMHQAMSVIASGGLLLRPQLVKEIRDPSGEVVYRFDAAEVRRVISERTARTMAGLLTKVVSSEGNAAVAAIPGYEVAGKTATAQKYIDGKPSTTHHIASFIGFFPASRPQIVISVVVDDADAHCPGGVAYGVKVAAPLFKHIAEQLIAYPNLDISPGVSPSAPGMLAFEGGHR